MCKSIQSISKEISSFICIPWMKFCYNPVSTFIMDQQGLNSLEEFCPLTYEEVKSLVKVTRHTGGTMTNPMAGPLFPLILNLGIPILLLVENNLELMCYLLQHMECTSCTITTTGITVTSICTLLDH